MKNINKTDQILILKNGKKLGYSLFGNPNGKPILAHHGNPGSRLFWGLLPEKSLYEEYRIIAPDRPGYGLSDHYFKDGLIKWPEIIVELLNFLQIDKCYNIGVSGGCPYALINASKFPERIYKSSLVSPLGPLLKESIGNMNINKKLFKLAPKVPWLLDIQFSLTTKLLKKNPQKFIQLFKRKVQGPDRKIMENKQIMDIITSDFLEAYRNGKYGSFYDCFIPTQWPIELKNISIPVTIWYGDKDRSIGDMGKYIAKTIPTATEKIMHGYGHFMIWELSKIIFDDLVN